MADEGKEQTQPHVESAATLFAVTSKVVGALVVVPSLAYLAGWQKVTAYYRTIGAPWVASMLAPSQILQEAAPLLFIVVVFGVISVANLLNKGTTAKIRQWLLGCMIVAALLMPMAMYPESWLGPQITYYMSLAGGSLMGVCAGLLIALVIGSFADAGMKWDGRPLILIHTLFIFGFWQAPNVVGIAQARLDSNPTLSKLPIVKIDKGGTEQVWRLVSPLPSQLLLTRLTDKEEEREFKLLAPSDIQSVLFVKR